MIYLICGNLCMASLEIQRSRYSYMNTVKTKNVNEILLNVSTSIIYNHKTHNSVILLEKREMYFYIQPVFCFITMGSGVYQYFIWMKN